jgi:hypothetical protein
MLCLEHALHTLDFSCDWEIMIDTLYVSCEEDSSFLEHHDELSIGIISSDMLIVQTAD